MGNKVRRVLVFQVNGNRSMPFEDDDDANNFHMNMMRKYLTSIVSVEYLLVSLVVLKKKTIRRKEFKFTLSDKNRIMGLVFFFFFQLTVISNSIKMSKIFICGYFQIF